jgi:hypothetical protein
MAQDGAGATVLDEQKGTDGGVRAAVCSLMLTQIFIVTVEPDGNDGVLVKFSDGSTAGYVVEELLELRPKRDSAALCQTAAVTIPTGIA